MSRFIEFALVGFAAPLAMNLLTTGNVANDSALAGPPPSTIALVGAAVFGGAYLLTGNEAAGGAALGFALGGGTILALRAAGSPAALPAEQKPVQPLAAG